jgi:hypothetical protein
MRFDAPGFCEVFDENEELLFEQVADLGEKLDVFRSRRWWSGGFLFLHQSHELIRWLHDDEEDYCGCNEKADQCADDHADVEFDGFCKSDFQVGTATTANQCEQRLDNAFGKCGDDAAKRSTNDDTGGEIDDVAFEDELLEFVEHRFWDRAELRLRRPKNVQSKVTERQVFGWRRAGFVSALAALILARAFNSTLHRSR